MEFWVRGKAIKVLKLVRGMVEMRGGDECVRKQALQNRRLIMWVSNLSSFYTCIVLQSIIASFDITGGNVQNFWVTLHDLDTRVPTSHEI